MTMTPEGRPGRTPADSLQGSASWIDRATRLQNLLNACPTNVLARCELATLLEELAQPEEAFLNWKAVLGCDPNNLQAREGMARCRQRIGRPLQSSF